MNEKETKNAAAAKDIGKAALKRRKHVASNRANAQRDKLDAQAEARAQHAAEQDASPSKGKKDQRRMQS